MSSLTSEKPADALRVIDVKAKRLADARADLASLVTRYNRALEKLNNQRIPQIRAAAAAVMALEAVVSADIKARPDLFVKPRTMTFHGIKLGLKKGTGSIEWDDEAKVIERIRKHAEKLSVPADVLIVVTESVSKEALERLPGDELKKLGVSLVDATDTVVLKAADTTVDKLVKAILKGGEKPTEDAE